MIENKYLFLGWNQPRVSKRRDGPTLRSIKQK